MPDYGDLDALRRALESEVGPVPDSVWEELYPRWSTTHYDREDLQDMLRRYRRDQKHTERQKRQTAFMVADGEARVRRERDNIMTMRRGLVGMDEAPLPCSVTDGPGVIACWVDEEIEAPDDWMPPKGDWHGQWPPDLLCFPGEDGWATYRPVDSGSRLDYLRHCSEYLAKRMDIHSAQATVLLLCDLTPIRLPIRRVVNRGTNPGITVEARYSWVTREELDEAYQMARQELHPQWTKRGRLPEVHTVAVFNFVEENTVGWSWEKRLKRWNKLHPDHQYSDYRSLANVYRQAKRVIT
ncbi:MAG: hypothetical protein CL878_08795 [Dehalococcoidia bacterium]|nr:hypothetical protein [Dehalococcoidia bacterium]